VSKKPPRRKREVPGRAARVRALPFLTKPAAAAIAEKQITAAAQRMSDAKHEQARIDEAYMRRAIELAEQYRGRTSPNPIVGCVIVDAHGNVIAEGAHRGPGTKHAEVEALDKIGRRAPGATLYVTLEPCTHQGRTPPCAPVVAAAGLARVVIGSLDPISEHAGGLKALERARVIVSRSLVDESDLSNLPFITWARTRRAAFTLKCGVTLDGKIATVTGESKWITSEEARAHGHRLRSTHDAIMTGIGTVLADDPLLTARIEGARDPVRVVVDSKLRTPATAKLLPRKGGTRTIVATTQAAPASRERALTRAGAEIWRMPADRGRVALEPLARRLADEDLHSVLVEGGGKLHASLIASSLATDLQLFIAPIIVGGPAPTWVGGSGVTHLEQAHRFRFVGEVRTFGGDLLVRAVRW
jgi:diaminohydroxyphosphoribosylaminopyrimidine deaminase/5-amino-6-(5-phosphoribosylamino)uracil reductase